MTWRLLLEALLVGVCLAVVVWLVASGTSFWWSLAVLVVGIAVGGGGLSRLLSIQDRRGARREEASR